MSAIFLSHSSYDNEAAAEVRERLESQGHRSIFLDFDPADGIPAGRSWEQELYARLKACQAIVVLCSEHSMASDWCFAEITHAKSMGKHVFPVKVGPCEIRSLLTEFQVLDLPAGREDAYARLFRGLEVAGLDPKNIFDWDGSRPPYPGLLAFQKEDAAIFFGRDAEIRDGLAQMRRLERFGGARFSLVLGSSGSGKSSLVRAGLLPRLERDPESWLATRPFRPLERPFEELARALAEALELRGAARSAAEVHRALLPRAGVANSGALVELAGELRAASGHPGATVLLPIDQLEELLGAPGEASHFLGFLRSALERPACGLRVLATLRSDFLGAFQGHPELRGMAFESLTVGPMTVEGFAQVIEGPASLAGVDLGPGLVPAMIEDTETEDALPLLAFALRELWEGYGEDARLGVEEYRDQLGGLSGAVALAAEAVMSSRPIPADEETDLRTAFLAMVRVDEEGRFARQPAAWSDLPRGVHDLLERFVAARLLVSRGDGRENRLEVAHEALLRSWDRLVSWLEEGRAFLLWRKRLAEALKEWRRTERHASALLRGPALAEAAGWSEKHRDLLDREEHAFVAASLAATRRQRRRRAAVIIGAVLALAAFAVTSHFQRQLTQKVMEMGHDANVLTHARAMEDEEPRLASRLFLELHHPRLFLHSLDVDRLELSGRLVGKSPEGMLTATSTDSGVDVQLTLDSRWSVHLPHDTEVYRAAIEGSETVDVLDLIADRIRSGRGPRVLTAAEDRVVRLWQLPDPAPALAALRDARAPRIEPGKDLTGRLLTEFDGHAERVSVMTVSPDGGYAATAAGDEVALWRSGSGAEPLLLGGHRGAVTAAAFDPGSRRLLTTSADAVGRIFDLRDVFAAPILLEGHRQSLVSGVFSLDGKEVLTLSADREVWLWSAGDGSGSQVATADCKGLQVGYSDVPGEAVLACADGTARVFDVEEGVLRELR